MTRKKFKKINFLLFSFLWFSSFHLRFQLLQVINFWISYLIFGFCFMNFDSIFVCLLLFFFGYWESVKKMNELGMKNEFWTDLVMLWSCFELSVWLLITCKCKWKKLKKLEYQDLRNLTNSSAFDCLGY